MKKIPVQELECSLLCVAIMCEEPRERADHHGVIRGRSHNLMIGNDGFPPQWQERWLRSVPGWNYV